jgi:tRNA(adenine34) deaminase
MRDNIVHLRHASDHRAAAVCIRQFLPERRRSRTPGHAGRHPARRWIPGRAAVSADHERFMRLALAQAAHARERGEVPIGALVVLDGEVIGEGFNQPIAAADPTAHAEVVAMRAAATAIGNYRLTGATLYVTVEPCLMCVGAMVHARIGLVVYGAPEPRAGALGSMLAAHEAPGLNHRLDVLGGVLEDDCRALIQAFFRDRR